MPLVCNKIVPVAFRKWETNITGWRKLCDLHSSPSVMRILNSRRMRWAGHVARMVMKRTAYKLLARKPERKRPLGKPRSRCVDKIKMNLVEIELGGMDWIGLAQDKYKCRSSCVRGNEFSRSLKRWETIKWLDNWWPLNSVQLHRIRFKQNKIG
jgi:hypothetical protein